MKLEPRGLRRAAAAAYLGISPSHFDTHRKAGNIPAPKLLFGIANPFFFNPYLGFFLQMLPYAFTIVILVLGSREAARKRLGAPAALGTPYVRGERGL